MTLLRLHPRAGRRSVRHTVAPLLALTALGLGLLLSGCGGGLKDDTVIATVGDKEITAGYYHDRLAKLESNELPRGEDGQVVDTGTPEGARAFLDVIIDKELMALKAEDLGYGEQENIAGAAQAMAEYHAGTALHKDLIEVPASEVTEQEVQDYYANLGTQRRCSYLITNFRDDALKARQELIDGALWADVAQKYHDGSKPPDSSWEVVVPWGRFEDSFEKAVFDLEEGQISQPVETVYGWWLLRLDGVEKSRPQPLDQIRDKVVDGIRMRKTNLARKKFIDEAKAKAGFQLDETSLWIIYQGLPEGEVLLDPETKQPTPREQLKPLDIPLEQMDRELYHYKLGDSERRMTIGDYKQDFDQANVFERPKRTDMLGGLRQKINQAVERNIIVQEAKDRGYMEDERVASEVDTKREEMMVSRLYADLVKIDNEVSNAELQALWDEVSGQYALPERRSGLIVFAQDENSAREAIGALNEGMEWPVMLKFYGTLESNIKRDGQTQEYREDESGPVHDALFGLQEVDQLSEPFPVQDRWAVVRLKTIEPARQREMIEVKDDLADRIRSRRKEAKLNQLLSEWREQYPVVVHEDKLGKLKSWQELQTAVASS